MASAAENSEVSDSTPSGDNRVAVAVTSYEKGRKITDVEMSKLSIKYNAFHGDWNYEIHPRK
jgi:hypothetical protein